MDGVTQRLRASVQRRLSVGLSLAILFVAILTGGIAFWSALDEAHELQDANLVQIAALMRDSGSALPQRDYISPPLQDEQESRIIIHRMTAGETVDGGRFVLPYSLAEGFHSLRVNQQMYRILISPFAPDSKLAVAQRISWRDEVARTGALRTLLPFFILIPILLILVADLVRKIFSPLRRLSVSVGQRREQDMTPLATLGLPTEVLPLVDEINRLLTRVSHSVDAQQRFVADAAHELRTPVTALSLQVESFASETLSPGSALKLQRLKEGISRTRNLLEQLLSLARIQSSTPAPAVQVDVLATVSQALADLYPLAERKQIDLGMPEACPAFLHCTELELYTLVKNLLDNAIRYTPQGGKIDLRLSHNGAGQVVIEVEDNGPGIPAASRQRVFDAFYRIEGSSDSGSGLGLSIVRDIVARAGGEITLSGGADGHGLKVMVRFN